MEIRWLDESTPITMRGGVRKVLEERMRARITWGYVGLAADRAYQVISLIQDAQSFLLIPRTKGAGDPEWAVEQEHECRLTSPLRADRDLASGLYRVLFEVETVGTYPALPSIVTGNFVLDSLAPNEAGVATFGDAQLLMSDVKEFTFLGKTYQYRTGTPFPSGLAALNVEQVEESGKIKKIVFASYLTIPTQPS